MLAFPRGLLAFLSPFFFYFYERLALVRGQGGRAALS
jgi:hypothetical protein